MDGFHLADATLQRLGLLAKKGAPETFDASGYVELLRRIRRDTATTIYAPGFERHLEQPIAGSIAIPATTQVVVTEGNYLLLDQAPWIQVAAELDEAWYVDTNDDARRWRLRARHQAFGKSPEAAARWVDDVDEPNASLVRDARERAGRFIAN